ncbi:MAG: DNRLRE domain-containing protein, partial [Prolixibacteraceae bacterium]|jgi:hypothetical protein|nr:DNRLRE domain-containing protein [Prolixibacteraceae bacterium]
LFAYDSPANGSHSTMDGSNEAILCRITSPWEENTVTWNNQPSVTTQNQVILPESNSSNQDYLYIDVTNLVMDMLDDPDNSHGFLLKLVIEEHYRSLIFASSDNDNPALHPKLEIYYSTSSTSSSSEKNSNINWRIYPNPANNYITIDLNNVDEDLINIDIVNPAGQIVKNRTSTQTTLTINVVDFSKGFYFIKIHNDDFVSTKKIIIN